jgi:bacterioferritin
MVASTPVEKIKDVKAMLQKARAMETGSIRDYNLWANECAANADAGSRKVFEGLVTDEERHYSQYDLEIQKIEKYGVQYLALQAMGGGEGEAAA